MNTKHHETIHKIIIIVCIFFPFLVCLAVWPLTALLSEVFISSRKKRFPNAAFYPKSIINAIDDTYIGIPLIFFYVILIILELIFLKEPIIFGLLIVPLLLSIIIFINGIFICKKLTISSSNNDDIAQAWILTIKCSDRNKEFLKICASLILKYHQEETESVLLGTFHKTITKEVLSFIFSYLIKRNDIIKNHLIFSETVTINADKLYKLAHVYTAFLTAELYNIKGFTPPFDNYWYWCSDSNTVVNTCESCITYLGNVGVIPKCDDIKESVAHLKELYDLDMIEILNRI